jgi:hypothetical protein
VEIINYTVAEVKLNDLGVAGLPLKSGVTQTADPCIDCSGFASVLLDTV